MNGPLARSMLRWLGAVLPVALAVYFGYVELARPRASCSVPAGTVADPFKAVFQVKNESYALSLRNATALFILNDVLWTDGTNFLGVKFGGDSLLELGDIPPQNVRSLTFDLDRWILGSPDVQTASFCVQVSYRTLFGNRAQGFGYFYDKNLNGQLLGRPCKERPRPAG